MVEGRAGLGGVVQKSYAPDMFRGNGEITGRIQLLVVPS